MRVRDNVCVCVRVGASRPEETDEGAQSRNPIEVKNQSESVPELNVLVRACVSVWVRKVLVSDIAAALTPLSTEDNANVRIRDWMGHKV